MEDWSGSLQFVQYGNVLVSHEEQNLQQPAPAKSKKKKEKSIEPPLVSEIPLYPGGKGNYIAALRTYCQKHALPIDFELVSTSGPSHRPMFEFRAIINGEPFPDGRGSSKKEAQGNAARLALDEREQLINICLAKQASIKEAAPPALQNTLEKKAAAGENTASAFNSNTVDYIDMLSDYAAKRSLVLEPIDSEVGDPPRHLCKWKLGNREFADCFGKNVLKARRNAARTAYHILANEFVSKFKTGKISTHFSSSSNIVSCTESFVNRFLSDYVKKKNLRTAFVETSSSASGTTQCFCKWKIGDREFGEAWGNSRAEAKKNAARLAFYTLVNESIMSASENSAPSKPLATNLAVSSDAWKRSQEDDRSKPSSAARKASPPAHKALSSSRDSTLARSSRANRPSLSDVHMRRVENVRRNSPASNASGSSRDSSPARSSRANRPSLTDVQMKRVENVHRRSPPASNASVRPAPIHAPSLHSPAAALATSVKTTTPALSLQPPPSLLSPPQSFDYTILLLAYAQKRKLKIVAADSYSGLSLPPTYMCKWKLDQRVIGEAYGPTLLEARRNAAKFAYDLLIKEETAGKVAIDSTPVAPCSTSLPVENHILSLVVFAKRNNLKINAVDSLSNLPFLQKCCCKWMLGQRVLSEAYGETVEEARQNSAKLAYDVLVKEQSTETKENTSKGKVVKDSTPVAACSTLIPTENHILSLVVFAKRNNLKMNAVDSVSNLPLPRKCCCKWVLGQRVLSEAYGTTVEEARQNSAKLAYDILVKEQSIQTKESTSIVKVAKDSTPVVACSTSIPTENHILSLVVFAKRNNLKINAVDSLSNLPHLQKCCCKWMLGQRVLSEAYGETVEEARQNSAKVAYNVLVEEQSTPTKENTSTETTVKACTPKLPPLMPSPAASYVSLLVDCARQKKLKINAVDSWSGLSSPPGFVCKWKVGQQVIGEAFGETIDEARQKAARVAYNELKKENSHKATRLTDSAELPPSVSFVNLLTSFAQQKKLKINAVDSWPGQSYPRKFTCKWKLGQKVLGEAYGTTMEEARQYAAKVAYSALLKEEKESLASANFSSAVDVSRNVTYPPVQTNVADRPAQMPAPVTNDNGRKRKAEDQITQRIKKLREEELQISLNYLRKEETKRRVIADLRRSQCICLQLDKQKGKAKPRETWFWPKLFIIDDNDVEEDQNEDEENKSLTIAEKLTILTEYLRDRHFYCVWCGRDYDGWNDLRDNCPGPRAELHK